jgi:CDP-paratose 2-epimerase
VTILVTGSGGLIGSAVVEYFCDIGEKVLGVDNDNRKQFFGQAASTEPRSLYLKQTYQNFKHFNLDISNYEGLKELFAQYDIKAIIHAAAQPSHDKAAEFPLTDFDNNATSTLKILEIYRQFAEEATFVHMSTNKVYGDGPNKLELKESDLRFDFADPDLSEGIAENFTIDNCLHSLFGVSKLAADVLVQEYGKYFGLRTNVLRGGCLTGPSHAGAKQHGFLSYLIKSAVHDGSYRVIGYKGKQVRDQIHAKDVAQIISKIIENPTQGEVFNLGGGRKNSLSILEIIEYLRNTHGLELNIQYENSPRIGDHICYYTNRRKLKSYYPDIKIEYPIFKIIDEMVQHEKYKFKQQDFSLS